MGNFNAPVQVEKKASRRRLILGIVGLGLVAGLIGGGYFVYAFLIEGGSGEASRDTEAQAINAATLSALASQNAPSGTEDTTEVVSEVATEAPTTEGSAAETPVAGEISSATEVVGITGFRFFSISSEESRVRFYIDEELRGQPTHVKAETSEVAGCIYVDTASPASTILGPIEINVRTLATDSDLRNRAIRSQILESAKDEFEFAHFVPTAITGLPESVSVQTEFTFQVTGDLTIRNITNSVTFDITLTPVSETRLEGIGTAQVTRAEYNLQIPNVPGVANVSDDVKLEIEFVAVEDAACAAS